MSDIGGPGFPGGRYPFNPPSYVPPPPEQKPLPQPIADVLQGRNPEGGIRGGSVGDIFENGLAGGGLKGGVDIGTLIGSPIGNPATDSDESAARVSGNNALGGPDTFNAFEVQMKLGKLKIRI